MNIDELCEKFRLFLQAHAKIGKYFSYVNHPQIFVTETQSVNSIPSARDQCLIFLHDLSFDLQVKIKLMKLQ